MTRAVEVENTDPQQHSRWLAKHGFQPDETGAFPVDKFEGKVAVSADVMLENIRINVSSGYYEPLYDAPYDERTFVMVCGGPSLAEHLDEIRAKTLQPDKYLVVCSNMTGGYLLRNGITPHVHFILDPQEKKQKDVEPGVTSPKVEYWINAACSPAVFAMLKAQGIKPYCFLADFDSEGKARKAVAESMLPGQPGMMAIQGGSMAGLRAINLADARGFRKIEYYGFDATVRVGDGVAQVYAYEKKRGEAIITVQCDRCPQSFDTTLILQQQVNEFLTWRYNMPWMDFKIFGGGLIAHALGHAQETEAKPKASYRYTEDYKAIQKALHAKGDYGISGKLYLPTMFHAISQLAKRHGKVTVLDYGSSSGNTFKHLKENFWLPPSVEFACYDPFVDEFSVEPKPADFVICTDVLEHVEPECTWAVLDHIQSLTKRIVFFSVSLQKAIKVLSDGRNAHINLRDEEFWFKEIKKRFILSEAKVRQGEELVAIGQSIDDVRETIKERNGRG